MSMDRAIIRYLRAALPFTGFSGEQLLNVARSIDMVKTEPGQHLVQEGTVGCAFFVVLAGTFGVYQKHALTSPYNSCAATGVPAAALAFIACVWSCQQLGWIVGFVDGSLYVTNLAVFMSAGARW
jgi:hypothetical protein